MVHTALPFAFDAIPLAGVAKDLRLANAEAAEAPKAADALVVLVPEGSSVPPQGDAEIGQLLQLLAQVKKFKGKAGEKEETLLPSGKAFQQGMLVGLGGGQPEGASICRGYDKDRKAHDPFRTYKVGKTAGAALRTVRTACVAVPADLPKDAKRALVEGLVVGLHPEQRFKAEKTPVATESLAFQGIEQEILDEAMHNVVGVVTAKELVDAPPNVCNPETLAKFAQELMAEGLEGKVLGREECEKRGMGAYLAVNQGSNFEPKFIHLVYKPQGGSKKKIALVGKGLTMDTGGYNVKSGASLIEQMKTDMGGAAAVLGAARIIARKKPNVEVHFIVAAAENMISSRAVRPGDVVKASNGKSIVVNNTDAEGRLTLADALVYAEKECAPDAIVDCATLTGALMVGLGTGMAGVYSTSDKLMEMVLHSGKDVGEALWPMPLFAPYEKNNEFPLTDLSNLPSSRWGGSISAAHFLKNFVEKTAWCHVDLPGPVYDAEEKFATGYGARFLAETACRFAQ